MPEGPEVAIISRCLDKEIRGETIDTVKIWKDSRYKPEDYKKTFNKMKGKTIDRVTYKGKKIVFMFQDGSSAISFLGMEGRWKVIDVFDPLSKHISLIFYLNSGKILQFQDQRHFGCMIFVPKGNLDSALKETGTPWIPSELYPKTVTKDLLYELTSNRRLAKKTLMMFLVDQKYTSGVGNYIRSDAMYISKLSPYRLVNSLTRKETDRLYDAVMKVMESALKAGGHTLRSYFTPIGETGGYTTKVYGRTISHPKGETVIREKDSTGRSFFWVPEVQI